MKLALAAATPVQAADVVPVVMAVSSQEDKSPLTTLKSKYTKQEENKSEKEEYAAPVTKGSFVFKRSEDSKIQGFSHDKNYRNEFKKGELKRVFGKSENENEEAQVDNFANKYRDFQQANNIEKFNNNIGENPYKSEFLKGFRKEGENNLGKDQPAQEEFVHNPINMNIQNENSINQNITPEVQSIQINPQPTVQTEQPIIQPAQQPVEPQAAPVPEPQPVSPPVASVQDDIQ